LKFHIVIIIILVLILENVFLTKLPESVTWED
jgi:hypothetical protein